ncbi:MAG: sigma 54-interacting transcriptional regulator [Planctomycetales bacterium]
MTAYLVVRQGNKWQDVYRLTPGQVMTVGRSPTNRLVLRDEVCSRNHCEIFQSGDEWVIRDLGSRNGTVVSGKVISGDQRLDSGMVINIGASELAFTMDLALPLPPLGDGEGEYLVNATQELLIPPSDHGTMGTVTCNPEILQRRRRSRYEAEPRESIGRDRTSRDLARLYRLALDMGNAHDNRRLAEVVLEGLMSGTPADIGAILTLPPGAAPESTASGRLSVVAYKSRNENPYDRVSDSLSRVVLKEREAILARDITANQQFAVGDSVGDLELKSVICAPLRREDEIFGLVHLYSTNPQNSLEAEHLDFTLAVADQCAIVMEALRRQEKLANGLALARDENKTLREQLRLETEMVGTSPYMKQLNQQLARVANSEANVLVRGESGVGKELVARAIHYSSPRRQGPFICMNCAALSESLLESELFGHEKGSFTGAVGRKTGKFEQAHQGTLLLDEVGEMSLAIQSKFLRVLEGHPFDRVGGGTPVKVDVRVVAATNRDLEKAVEEGTFRKDLYFRLHVVELKVQPLREHPSDIPELASFFLERFARRSGRTILGFTSQALELLTQYDWPGNVRELQNAIERAVILANEDLIDVTDLHLSRLGAPTPPRMNAAGIAEDPKEMTLDRIEQRHILATLEMTGWNKSQAAQILGIERSTLDRKLKRYQVQSPRAEVGDE